MGTVHGHEFPGDAPGIWGHVSVLEDGPGDDSTYEFQLPPCHVRDVTWEDLPAVPGANAPLTVLPPPIAEGSPSRKEQLASEGQVHEASSQVYEANQGPVELNGRRKSLLIGINYFGSPHELHGCVDDVHRMLPLVKHWGFGETDCQRILLDAPDWQGQRPTLANLRAAIAWLVHDAQPGDAFLLHYSGHGGRVPRSDGRGEWHETLCPVDMDEAGMLHDSELFEILVKPLPKGCRLTCILDACHSAGALDLPFIFTGTLQNIQKAMAGEAIQMALSKNWLRDFERWKVEDDPMALLGDVASVGFGLWDLWRQYRAKTHGHQDGFCSDEPFNVGLASAEVVAITGCASDQTSADVNDVHSQFDLHGTSTSGRLGRARDVGDAGGALTSALIEAMEQIDLADQHQVSILDLLEHLRARLADAGFSQVPQLASSVVLDLKQPFSFTTVNGKASASQEGLNRDLGTSGLGSTSGLGTTHGMGMANGLGMLGASCAENLGVSISRPGKS